jgi:CheY-like chemotaxis protein
MSEAPSSEPYQLILMDCQMPNLDGYEATQQIRAGRAGKSHLGVPIIAMTANTMKGDKETCFAAGMSDYIGKPIDPSILEERMHHWLNE